MFKIDVVHLCYLLGNKITQGVYFFNLITVGALDLSDVMETIEQFKKSTCIMCVRQAVRQATLRFLQIILRKLLLLGTVRICQ